ncbi:NRDE family protein [Streptacidiphilus sp. PAMC 29251]
MCTAVISVDPAASCPVLLVGIRDEFHDRSWLPPGRHWPDRPNVVGGQDLLAGGTWLAVDPGEPRAAAVLNSTPTGRRTDHGPTVPDDVRLSRGDLPLRFAADGRLGALDTARYEPFYLVCATLDEVRMVGWDGETLTDRALGPGLHIVTNLGLAGPELRQGPGMEEINARIAHFQPRLAAAQRPTPGAGTTAAAWGDWLPLVEGDGLDPSDPRALLLRQDVDGRAAGTTSMTMVALGRDTLRYDFHGTPVTSGPWANIL